MFDNSSNTAENKEHSNWSDQVGWQCPEAIVSNSKTIICMANFVGSALIKLTFMFTKP